MDCCHITNTKTVNYLPDDAIVVDTYDNFRFEFYYFYEDKFYHYNGINFDKLNINENFKGDKFCVLWDVESNPIPVKFNKFKVEKDLI